MHTGILLNAGAMIYFIFKLHLKFRSNKDLTPWCRVLLEQLTGLQLVKKFLAFHGTRRFITALKSVVSACHHGMARPEAADRGTASDKEGSCE